MNVKLQESGSCHYSPRSVVSSVLADHFLACANCLEAAVLVSLQTFCLYSYCFESAPCTGGSEVKEECRQSLGIISLATKVVWLQALKLQLQIPVDMGSYKLLYIKRAKSPKM